MNNCKDEKPDLKTQKPKNLMSQKDTDDLLKGLADGSIKIQSIVTETNDPFQIS